MSQGSQAEPAVADGDAPVPSVDTSARRSPIVLIVLATVLGIVAMLAVWVRAEALDTDEWVKLSDELLAEPEVSEALAVFLVDQLYERVDLSADLGDRLPDSLSGVASTLAGALRGTVTDATERIISSERFRSAWTTVNRTAHSALVAILRDETPDGISTADGDVTLELRGLIVVVGETLGFSAERLDRIPDDAGRLTIFESDELAQVQRSIQILDVLSWLVMLVVVAMFAAAVALARGERIATLRKVGIALVGAGVFVLLARTIAVRQLVESLVADPSRRGLADVITANATSMIQRMAWSAIAWGVLILLFAALLGTHRWATTLRRLSAPALNASVMAVAGGTLLFIMLLVWWSPGRAFAGLISGLTLIALVISAVVALRVQTAREFLGATDEYSSEPAAADTVDVPA